MQLLKKVFNNFVSDEEKVIASEAWLEHEDLSPPELQRALNVISSNLTFFYSLSDKFKKSFLQSCGVNFEDPHVIDLGEDPDDTNETCS